MADNIKQLQADLEQARVTIKEQADLLEMLSAPPLDYATVIGEDKKYTTMATKNGICVFPRIADVAEGDTVLIAKETGVFIEKAEHVKLGVPLKVESIVDDHRVRLKMGGESRVVLSGKFKKLKEDDLVMLDITGSVVVEKMEVESERFIPKTSTLITWDHIGGQERAKREMIEAVELPLKYPEVFKFYQKRPTKGILLYGPPGCGKTMFAKAAATSISTATGGDGSGGFIYVKGPEILDPYVGVAEATIRELFASAREFKQTTGTQAVIFIDEADALLGQRGERYAMMEKTIVPMFLTEMDGLGDSSALVILATNRPDTLDPAITRDGRIDRKVRVSRPTPSEAAAIFKLNMNGKPVHKSHSAESMIEHALGVLFSEDHAFCEITLEGGSKRRLKLADMVSGAMIANIVESATSNAMHRDMQANVKKPTGLTAEDMQTAILDIYRANRDTNHKDLIGEVAENRNVVSVRRLAPTA